MLRTAVAALSLLSVVATVAGCPDRDEVVEQVGGAPGRQVNDARVRATAAEEKIKAQASEAAAVGTE